MASLFTLLNRLLPFATPGTPLVQDLAHLAAICVVLYFAPSIQEWNSRRVQRTQQDAQAFNSSQDSEVTENVNAVADDHARNQPTGGAVENVLELPEAEDRPLNGVEDSDSDSDDDDEPQEGPIEPGQRATTSAQRNIGAKKAKSLARKDQRKAYHEFMRSQGEAQRARDAEGAAEREAVLEAERKRRALVEAELDAKKAREREQKREVEKAEREAEYRRREMAVALVKADLAASNLSDLHRIAIQVGGDVDVEWVEKVIKASGLIGRKGDVLTLITSTGWAAVVTKDHAAALYNQAATEDISDSTGNINVQQMSKLFVDILRQPLFAV